MSTDLNWDRTAGYVLAIALGNQLPEDNSVPEQLRDQIEQAILPIQLDDVSVAFLPTQPGSPDRKALRLRVYNSGRGAELIEVLLAGCRLAGLQAQPCRNGGVTSITVY